MAVLFVQGINKHEALAGMECPDVVALAAGTAAGRIQESHAEIINPAVTSEPAVLVP